MRQSENTDATPTIAQQTSYWDERWNKQNTPNGWQQRRAEAVVALARELPLEDPRILDLGCGTGFATRMLGQIGPAEGIDLSPAAIAIARAENPTLSFSAGDLFEIDFGATPRDLIVCQEVIPHVDDQLGLVNRIADALKPGGYVIMTAANRFVMSRLDGRDGGPIGKGPLGRREHIKKWLSMGQLKALMRPRFEIMTTTSVLPLGQRGILRLINSHKLNKTLSSFVSEEKVEALKCRMGWGYTIIVVGRKKA